jgi:hypothetical protein
MPPKREVSVFWADCFFIGAGNTAPIGKHSASLGKGNATMQTLIETSLATLCFLFVGAIVAIAFI